MSAFAAAALGTAAALFVLPASAALADGSGELESGFLYPATAGSVTWEDPAASAGRVAALRDAGSIDLSVNNATATTSFRIRAKQWACGPEAARMAVKVDTVTVATITVPATGFTDYTITGTWAAGWRDLHIDFLNPYAGGTCGNRWLLLDRVDAISAPATPAYYVDAVAGNDSANGRSPATAWKTVGKVNATALPAGETVLFKRGQTFTNPAGLPATVTSVLVADNPGVTYGAYGTGAQPIFDGGGQFYPIEITGASVKLQDLQAQNAGRSDKIGIVVSGTDALLQRITARGNAIGVQAMNGAHRMRLTGSQLVDNTTVIAPPGQNDDYGASGVVVLQADNTEIDHNTISRNVGPSPDFREDGSAVEIFGAKDTVVHHNISTDNHTFTELGHVRTERTTFHNNLITAAAGLSPRIGFNAQGTGDFGPVKDTRIFSNTVVIAGTGAWGVLADEGATMSLHNNIIQADLTGWSAQPVDEGHNVYAPSSYLDIPSQTNPGGIAPTSVVADPKFTGTGNYQLQSTSPAKNRGVAAYASSTTDVAGNPRAFGAPDAGAYERQSS